MRRLRFVLALLLAAGIRVPAARAAGDEPKRESRPPDTIRGQEEEGEFESVEERLELYLAERGQGAAGDPTNRLRRLREEYDRRRTTGDEARTKAGGLLWVSLGPTNGAGRMTSIAPHPTRAGTVYAGAAGGGVWKTEDDGASWQPLTDDLPDLSVGALAIAPSAPDTIYVGTGEPMGSAGIGLVTSTDGGATWVLPDSVVAAAFYRISVHPSRAQELVAGTDSGGLRSTDGGRTWTRFLPGVAVTDIVRSPADPAVLYAATYESRVWKSEDGGVHWTESGSGIPPAGVRLSLAISPSDPRLLYAACETSGVSHIFKSTDGGQSWLDLDSVRNGSDAGRFLGTLGRWANAIAILPGPPEVVIAGGVSAIRSTDGGATWSPLPGTHADFHDFRSQGSNLWLANDGGIWTSPDGGQTAVDRNSGLVTRQYYSIADDPAHPNRVLAGAQDNGTSQRTDAGGTDWRLLGGGDGFDCAVDPLEPTVLFTSEAYGMLMRFTDSGDGALPAEAITPPYGEGEARPFHTVIALDPSRPGTIYTGSTRVWRSTDDGGSWSPLSTTTSAGGSWNDDGVTAIAVAPSDPRILLVGKGTSLYRTDDAGQTWTRADSGLPGARINRIAIDPANASIAYAALATTGGASVYGTSNSAAHWEPRSAGLPPFAALVLRIDPGDPDVLYCGNSVGVYRSTDQGENWSRFGSDLPAASVQDLQINGSGRVRIATYGRGAWELDASRTPPGRGAPVLPCPSDGSECPGPRQTRVVPPLGR